MKKRYEVRVKFTQEVTKEVKIALDAYDEDDLVVQVEKALETYPREILTNSIHRMYCPSTEYKPPVDIEYLSVKEDKRFA